MRASCMPDAAGLREQGVLVCACVSLCFVWGLHQLSQTEVVSVLHCEVLSYTGWVCRLVFVQVCCQFPQFWASGCRSVQCVCVCVKGGKEKGQQARKHTKAHARTHAQ
jgi:hypothetical protein